MKNEYLDNFINFLKVNFQQKPCIIWDMNLRCLFASKIYKDYVNKGDIEGKTMEEISEDFGQLKQEFYPKVTAKMIANQRAVMTYFLLPSKVSENSFDLNQATLYPLFDPHTGQLIAIFTEANRIGNDDAFAKLISQLSETNNAPELKEFEAGVKVTERERIIIFLLITGRSHKEIAEIISKLYNKLITANNISSIMSKQIYRKFNVSYTSALIYKAIKMGFLYNIPAILVQDMPRVIHVIEDIDISQIVTPSYIVS